MQIGKTDKLLKFYIKIIFLPNWLFQVAQNVYRMIKSGLHILVFVMKNIHVVVLIQSCIINIIKFVLFCLFDGV